MKKKEKVKINKKIKISIMMALIGIVCILGGLCFIELQINEVMTEEKVMYDYTQTNGVQYAVNLSPNEVYDTDKLPEGQIYLTEFLKDINTYFTSTFKGSEAATIEGEYEIVARVAGYMTEKEVKTDVWSKDFILSPKQSFKGEGTDYKVEKTVNINYHSYDEFAKAVAEVSKVNLPMELRIIMTGNISAKTPYEVVEKPIQTSVVIPLGNSYFAITAEGEVENKDSIKEVAEVIVSPNQKKITTYGVLIGATLLIFIGVLLGIEESTVVDRNRKNIRKIFTNHGSRMIGVDEILESGYKTTYRVKGIEDLIKIADEIEKPLLYKHSEDEIEINKFYVMDKDTLYTWEIQLQEKGIINRQVQEKTSQESEINIEL